MIKSNIGNKQQAAEELAGNKMIQSKIPAPFKKILHSSYIKDFIPLIKIFLLIIILLSSCAKSYVKKLQTTEEDFYQGKYNSAVNEIRELVQDADAKDRLLYLMEAGVILHSMGEYEKSNLALKDADNIAETIKTSISRQAAAFLLSDRKVNFKGENFERVLIKFYIALNYLMLNDYDVAKRYFRKLNYELKEMKYEDQKYKQNVAARYLDAIISESKGNYNDARVQYKNIQMVEPDNRHLLLSRYVLAEKESDAEDMTKYQAGKQSVLAFNKEMQPVSFHPKMGELIIIHQAGKAPTKESRGRLLEDEAFMVALRVAIHVAIVAEGAALSTTGVLAMMTTAENPVPIYMERDRLGSREIQVFLNDTSVGKTEIMNDYKTTAIQNFNDNYSKLVTKNVASIATKIVIAAIAADALSDKLEEGSKGNVFVSKLVRFCLGMGAGKAVAATVEPDLRCWRLLPSNFQIKRIFLEPGDYKISFKFRSHNTITTHIPNMITVRSGQPTFVNFRSMTRQQ